MIVQTDYRLNDSYCSEEADNMLCNKIHIMQNNINFATCYVREH